MNDEKPVILAISDNPLLTTGFGQVCGPMYEAFVNQGWNLHVIGVLSGPYDYDNDLRYRLYPTNPIDPMGFGMIHPILTKVNPDIVWILTDPGNLYNYLYSDQGLIKILRDIQEGEYQHIGLNEFKIVAYIPVEGSPQGPHQLRSIQTVEEEGGKAVLYCQSAVDAIRKEWPEMPNRYVFHGLDHGNMHAISPEDRTLVRKYVGIDDKFVVGVFGANKRTKCFAETVYTARILKDEGYDNILFYFHTEWDHPVSQGVYLKKMIEDYNVKDMIVVKPDLNSMTRGNEWSGVRRTNGVLQMLKKTGWPPPPNWYDEVYLWNGIDIALLGDLDFNLRLNMIDILFDPSSVEGWGLITGEAGQCKRPTLGLRDYSVRDEVYGDSRFILEPLEAELWDTWHVGARLVKFHPRQAARQIVELSTRPDLIEQMGEKAYQNAQKYKWQDSADKMVNIVLEALDEQRQERNSD